MAHQTPLPQDHQNQSQLPEPTARGPLIPGLTSKPLPVHADKKVDHRQLTIEGFRSLGILATFLAALQAQILSATLGDFSTTTVRLTNAFWLAGLFLDIFGAVLAILTARWFEVLDAEGIGIIDETWTIDPEVPRGCGPQWRPPQSFIAWLIANALFSGFPVVVFGVIMFVVGLLLFVWDRKPVIVSIISTIPFVLLAPLVAMYFYPRPPKKADIVKILTEKRGRW